MEKIGPRNRLSPGPPRPPKRSSPPTDRPFVSDARPGAPKLPLGRTGERIALDYLTKVKKFKIAACGFRHRRGEIDIIGWDGTTLVFVEVKARRGVAFGRPEEAVTPAKQRQIRRLAQAYLLKSRLRNVNCRFDVVSVRIGNAPPPRIDHFPDAF